MAKILRDEELEKFEEDIRILKNKYDQFFAGISKFPPMQDRRNLEVFIHEMNKQKMRDNTRRFRFTTLMTRYNQLREMWGRKMREREEGPMEFRRRQAALEAPSTPPPPPPPQPSAAGARVTSAPGDPYVKLSRATNGEGVKQLYEQIEREHLKLGRLPNVTLDQVQAMVQKQSEMVRSKYQVDTVAFRVDVVDGKVKLKAKPIQE